MEKFLGDWSIAATEILFIVYLILAYRDHLDVAVLMCGLFFIGTVWIYVFTGVKPDGTEVVFTLAAFGLAYLGSFVSNKFGGKIRCPSCKHWFTGYKIEQEKKIELKKEGWLSSPYHPPTIKITFLCKECGETWMASYRERSDDWYSYP